MRVRLGRHTIAAITIAAGLTGSAGCGGGDLGPGFIDEDDAVELCAGEVEVPDENLRELLFELLPQPEPPEDAEEEPPPVVLAEELRKLTGLRANGLGITDLTGLECAVRLESLGLAGNELTNLAPLQSITGIRELELSENQISDLRALEAFPLLEKLSLTENGITDIRPLANLSELQFVDLADNGINDIRSLAGLEKMRGLVLSNNQIGDISALAQMPELVALKLDNNAIASIAPLDGLTELRYIDLDGNEITTLAPLRAATRLLELEASRNALTTLSGVENKPEIIRIVANENMISSTAGVSGLTELTVLELGENQLQFLAGLQTLPNLRNLRVASNQLTTLSAVSGLPELRTLDIRANPGIASIAPVGTLPLLGDFFAGGVGQTLDLSPLAGRGVLRRISFREGQLVGDLAFLADVTALEVLDLAATPLTDAMVGQMAVALNLQNLNLDDTGVSDLAPIAVLGNIESLSARRNMMSSLQVLAGWPGVREVRVLGNPITGLEGTETLEVLGILEVSQTQVADLGPLVANETFRRGDELIIEDAALDAGDCGDVAMITAREAVVTTDLDCG